MEIRNTSPLGDLDVTLLGRVVEAGEVIDVTDEQAVELCAGMASFEPVDGEAFAAAVLERGEEFAHRYLAEAAGLPVEEPEPPTEDGYPAIGGQVPADESAQAALTAPGVGPDFLIPGGADETPLADEAVPDESATKTKTRRASTDDTKEA